MDPEKEEAMKQFPLTTIHVTLKALANSSPGVALFATLGTARDY